MENEIETRELSCTPFHLHPQQYYFVRHESLNSCLHAPFISEAFLGGWTDSPSFLDQPSMDFFFFKVKKPLRIMLRDLAQKFEQRKWNYSTPQITKASEGNETEVYQACRLLNEVIFSFVQTRKAKKRRNWRLHKG